MNIAVLNIASNVGKTVVAKHLLQPRLNLDYLLVGALGDDAHMTKADKKLSAEDYSDIQDLVIANQHMVVDVSSTHIEQFLQQMAVYEGSHEDYSYFILPTTNDFKAVVETEKTLQCLLKLGLKPSRIRMVLNKTTTLSPMTLTIEFADVIELAKRHGIQVPTVGLESNALYPDLRRYHLSFVELLNRQVDQQKNYTARWSNSDQLKALRLLASEAQINMDAVFADLRLEVVVPNVVIETTDSLIAAN